MNEWVRYRDSCSRTASDSERQGAMVLAQHNIRQENEKLAMVVFVGGSHLHETWPSQPTTGEFSGIKGPEANAVSSGHCLRTMTVEDIASKTQDYQSSGFFRDVKSAATLVGFFHAQIVAFEEGFSLQKGTNWRLQPGNHLQYRDL